jgi:hypothetical protein
LKVTQHWSPIAINPTGQQSRSILQFSTQSHIYKRTALLHAARSGQAAIAEVLLASGSDVDEPGGLLNECALHWACTLGDEKFALFLMAAGATVDARTIVQRTPLHLACSGGKTRMVQLMLAHHADVNATDRDLQTPLHHLVMLGESALESQQSQIDIASLLARGGAKIEMRDANNATAIDLATAESVRKYLRALVTAPAAPPPQLQASEVVSNPTLAAINARPAALPTVLSSMPTVPALQATATPAAMATQVITPVAAVRALSPRLPQRGAPAAPPAADSTQQVSPRTAAAAIAATAAVSPPPRALAASPTMSLADAGTQPVVQAAMSPRAAQRGQQSKTVSISSSEPPAPAPRPAAAMSPTVAPRGAATVLIPSSAAAAASAAAARPISPPAPVRQPSKTFGSPARSPPQAQALSPRLLSKSAAPAAVAPAAKSPTPAEQPLVAADGTAVPPKPTSPEAVRSGRQLPTPTRTPPSALSASPKPVRPKPAQRPAALSAGDAPVDNNFDEFFSSDALVSRTTPHYESIQGLKDTVVYEVLLPDQGRVTVQYEVLPPDFADSVRESTDAGGGLEVAFVEASDDDVSSRSTVGEASSRPSGPSRDEIVAAQQAQLERIMQEKRLMEEQRKSVFILEKRRRERSVYQVDEAQRNMVSTSARNDEPAVVEAETVAARASPVTRTLATSGGDNNASDSPSSVHRLPEKLVPSHAPPPPRPPTNVDPFSSVRFGKALVNQHVSNLIAEDATIVRGDHSADDDNADADDDDDDADPPPPPPTDADEDGGGGSPRRALTTGLIKVPSRGPAATATAAAAAPQVRPNKHDRVAVSLCKVCRTEQATARVQFNSPIAECCKACALVLKQKEMRAPAGRPPCEQCRSATSVAIVTLTGIRGVRDTVAAMCKPCAVHWLSRAPKATETRSDGTAVAASAASAASSTSSTSST